MTFIAMETLLPDDFHCDGNSVAGTDGFLHEFGDRRITSTLLQAVKKKKTGLNKFEFITNMNK